MIALETAPDTGRSEIVIKSRSPFQGAKVSNISPAVADELRLDSNIEGVVIVELGDDAPAQSVGFKKGDVILNVNNQKIADEEWVPAADDLLHGRWLVVRRGKRTTAGVEITP